MKPLDLKIPPGHLSQASPETSPSAEAEEIPQDFGMSPEDLQLHHLLNRRGSGKKVRKPPLEAHYAGPLALADLQALDETHVNGRQKASTVTLNKLRSIHHQIAQYLSQGYSNIEVSAILGVTSQRISLLKSDPAFAELQEFYAGEQRAAGAAITERLQTITILGLEELQDRLLDEPELMSVPQIAKIVEMALDRSGHGPGGQNGKGEVNLPSDEVSKVKEALAGQSKTQVISRAEFQARQEAEASTEGQTYDQGD